MELEELKVRIKDGGLERGLTTVDDGKARRLSASLHAGQGE